MKNAPEGKTPRSGPLDVPPPPMLLDQIDYLYGMVTKADSRPSRDAFTRYAELKEMLDALLEEVRQLRRGVAEDR